MKRFEKFSAQNIRIVLSSPFFAISMIILALLFFLTYLHLSPLVILAAFVGLFLAVIVIVKPEIGLSILIIYVLIEGGYFFNPPKFGPISLPILLEGLLILAVAFKVFVKKERLFGVEIPVKLLGIYVILILLSSFAAFMNYALDLQALRQVIIVPLMLAFLVFTISQNREKIRNVFFTLMISNILILTSTALVSLGYLKLAEPEKPGLLSTQRLSGFVQDPNGLSFILISFFVINLFLFFYSTRKPAKIAFLALMLVNLIATLFTLSRGGFVALIGVLLFLYLKFTRNIKVFALLLLLSLILYAVLPQALMERFAEVKSIGNIDRVALAKTGLNMTLASPLFGVGPGNFSKYFLRYSEGAIRTVVAPHNMYLSISSQLGIPALIMYLLILFFLWKKITFIEKKYQHVGFTNNLELATGLILKLIIINIVVMGLSLHIEHSYFVMIILGVALSFTKMMADE